MTLRTTYFGGIGSLVEPADGDLVLGVVRYPQDFVQRVVDRNIPALAPPEQLLDAYKAVEGAADEDDDVTHPRAVAWASVNYAEQYRAYLEQPGPIEVIGTVRDQLQERDVWLVCWEKNPQFCHRRLLADAVAAEVDVEITHHPEPSEPDATADGADEPRNASLADFGGELS